MVFWLKINLKEKLILKGIFIKNTWMFCFLNQMIYKIQIMKKQTKEKYLKEGSKNSKKMNL